MSVSSLRPRYGFHNFFISTVANYSLCEIPDRPPDFWSPSGSVYWNCGDSVKRCSDHWGPNIASCRWFLDFESMSTSYALCGDCLYEDFRPTWVLEEFKSL